MTTPMGHLGDEAAAFVDGELDHDSRDRVMGHLAHCANCRAEVASERLVKERLQALVDPTPPPALLAALARMSEPGEPIRPSRRGAGETVRPPTVPVGGRPAGRSSPRRAPRSRRMRTALVSSTTAVVATLVTAFVVGGPSEGAGTTVTPDVGQYVVDHAATSRGLPFPELPTDTVGVTYRHSRR